MNFVTVYALAVSSGLEELVLEVGEAVVAGAAAAAVQVLGAARKANPGM